jgi:RimJ/RimL family protein N-acetyltransferase
MPGDIRLRQVSEGDLPIFFEHQRDPEANRMAAFPARNRQAFFAHWAKILGDRTVLARTILWQGQVAGNLGCFEQEGKRLVGYWLGQEFWGQGIASKALAEFLVLVKERPLYAHVAKHNVASVRVLERCGFTICDGPREVSVGDGEVIEELTLKLVAEEKAGAN